MEPFIERYLEETGQRLDILTAPAADDLVTDRLEDEEHGHWWEFALGLERLKIYLQKHHTEEYHRSVAYNSGEDATEYEYVQGLVDLYRKRFDPSAVDAEIAKLEAEYDKLMEGWRDLPTAIAKARAKKRFEEVEARIEQLREQKKDAATVVEEHYHEMETLRDAIEDATKAFQAVSGERALRHKAEAIRKVIQRIECRFVATGKTGGGSWANRGHKLVSVTIYPLVGEPLELDSEGALQSSIG
jgi:hypothetical protein